MVGMCASLEVERRTGDAKGGLPALPQAERRARAGYPQRQDPKARVTKALKLFSRLSCATIASASLRRAKKS